MNYFGLQVFSHAQLQNYMSHDIPFFRKWHVKKLKLVVNNFFFGMKFHRNVKVKNKKGMLSHIFFSLFLLKNSPNLGNFFYGNYFHHYSTWTIDKGQFLY
jgi:hypothetical protein